MGGLLLILAVVAFDLWMLFNIGLWKLSEWREQKKWGHIAAVAAAGLLLAVWFSSFVKYSNGDRLRVQGFPIPVVFFHLDGKTWTRTTTPGLLHVSGVAANFLTGLAVAFIPFKIARFLNLVKEELQ